MKQVRNVMFMLAAIAMQSVSTSAYAVNWQVNQDVVSIEYIKSLRVVDGGKDNLYIDYKECTSCKAMKLMITDRTAIYEGGESVPKSRLKERLGREASLRYNKETLNVISVTTH